MRKRAFTLVEILVYSLLLLMILAGIYGAFSLSRDYFSVVRTSTEVNQEAMKALLGLERELSNAAPKTIATSSNPPGVRFLSALPTDNKPFAHDEHGKLLWQRWMVIYLDQKGQLALKSQDIAPSATLPAQASWPDVSTLAGNSAIAARVLARNVVELAFPAAPPELFRVTVRSRMEEARFPSGRSVTFDQKSTYETTFQGEIPLRNGASL